VVWLIERGARRETESPLLLLLAAWPALRRTTWRRAALHW